MDWTALTTEWSKNSQLIVPDLRGHGRSSILSKPFRHQDAAADMLALLDRLEINICKALGISGGGGGNVLRHMATMQPKRVKAMVLVSARPYFPARARPIMREYPSSAAGKSCDAVTPVAMPDQCHAGEHQSFRRQL